MVDMKEREQVRTESLRMVWHGARDALANGATETTIRDLLELGLAEAKEMEDAREGE